MTYTIRQISELTGLTPHTLRYYDKEGLLPLIGRGGRRLPPLFRAGPGVAPAGLLPAQYRYAGQTNQRIRQAERTGGPYPRRTL